MEAFSKPVVFSGHSGVILIRFKINRFFQGFRLRVIILTRIVQV